MALVKEDKRSIMDNGTSNYIWKFYVPKIIMYKKVINFLEQEGFFYIYKGMGDKKLIIHTSN